MDIPQLGTFCERAREYLHAMRAANPTSSRFNPNRVAERFWRKVAIGAPGECWEWKAGKTCRGYGTFCINRKGMNASRAAWILVHGPISDDQYVCHHCDNTGCCNPKHLFLGDAKSNMVDKMLKGRCNPAIGERGGKVKLTEKQVIEIRLRYSMGGETMKQIASDFPVTWKAVQKIVRGMRWKHLMNPTIQYP